MVYMDPNELGWRPYVKSWMQRTCSKMKDETKVFKYCSCFRFCDFIHLSILSNCYWNKYSAFKAMQKTAIACFRSFQQFRMLGTDFEDHLRTFLDF